ncbi:MAG: helix-turn-helix domain-containing protein, partial [Pedobacter sp.]
MQIAPVEQLKDLIKHFIIYEPQKLGQPLRFFTDGNPGLVIPLENYRLPFLFPPVAARGEVLAYGPMDRFIDIPAPPLSGLVAVVLQPYGLETLTGLPSSLFRNKTFWLNEIPRCDTSQVSRDIRHMRSSMEVIPLIESYLLKIISGREPINPIIRESLNLMQSQQGAIPIGELLETLAISERNLERKFDQFIGLSPKKLAGILRINYYLKLIRDKNSPTTPLVAAIAAGYYDQAHLNNHFKS